MSPELIPSADPQQLLEVALGRRSPKELSTVSLRGLDALVAYRKNQLGIQLTSGERRALAANATTWTLQKETLEEVSAHLHAADLPFVLLKGAAVAHHYPLPYLRPTSDLDLLISHEHLAEARRRLCANGWQSVATGRFAEAYLHHEGSCWQGYRTGRVVLELHIRFWGSVASSFPDSVFSSSYENARHQRVPSTVDKLIIAASHAWRQPTPRRAADLLDVCLLLQDAGPSGFQDLRHAADLAGQTLPVCLSLDLAAATLGEPWIYLLLGQLESALRSPEHRVLSLVRRNGQDQTPWSRLRLAMLLARRPSRAGWKSVVRQIWPHKGVLERRTADHQSWPARRLTHLLRTLRAVGGGRR